MHITKFRNAKKLTQSQLAERSGVDLSIINRLENGKRQTASYETIIRLAHALGVEPQQLAPVRLPPLEPATAIE